ncbi:MAG TPA: hypothetical protein PLE74_06425 [Candidatus Cloacimonadota bacterium]|nr:hypothetical protein [Candidatus Cloacimonadota bacterium]
MKSLLAVIVLLFAVVLHAEPNYFEPLAEAIMKDGTHIIGYFSFALGDGAYNEVNDDTLMYNMYTQENIPLGTDLMPFVTHCNEEGYIRDYARTKYGNFAISDSIQHIDLNYVSKLILLTPPQKDKFGDDMSGIYRTNGWTKISQADLEKIQNHDTGISTGQFPHEIICVNPALPRSEFYLYASLYNYNNYLEVANRYDETTTFIDVPAYTTAEYTDFRDWCDSMNESNYSHLKQALADVQGILKDWLQIIPKNQMIKEEAKPPLIAQINQAINNCVSFNAFIDKSFKSGKMDVKYAPASFQKIGKYGVGDIAEYVIIPKLTVPLDILNSNFDELLPTNDMVVITHFEPYD